MRCVLIVPQIVDNPIAFWQVCCNLATMTHPLFDKQPVPYALSPKTSNPKSLAAAVDAAVSMLSKVSNSCSCKIGCASHSKRACHSPYQACQDAQSGLLS